jgi:hypothetical protein
MSQTRKLTYSLVGGEVTPEFWGQIGDAKFQLGLATCRNFIIKPHGPAANRAGFAYVATVKTPAKRTRLIPFTYSATQTMVLEFGEFYLRFHTLGSTLLAGAPAAYNGATAYTRGSLVSSGGVNYYCILATTGNAPPNATYWYPLPSAAYEIPTPFAAADLFDIHFVQSADVLTLCHPNYPPSELRRLGATTWTLTPIAFLSSLAVPAPPTATSSASGTTTGYYYVVTSVGATGLEESAPSAAASCINNLLVTGAFNTIAWASTSATRYNVYKQGNGIAGLYGYIGQTDGLSFVDDNITPNMGKTPPIVNNPFASAGLYPGAVSYHEQRRCFAGSTNEPQNLRMTRSGTESNMTYSIPVRDDDSINIRVAAREANTIRHIVPLANLVLLTAAAEWRVTSINSDAITPTSVSVKPQSYIGANNVQPVIVNNNIIYGAARGGHLREMAFNYQAGGYITGDLSLRAPHLFDNLDLVDLAYAKAPQPLVWAVSSNGKLLGLTYVPEQSIGAIHQHDTDGTFESCCVVSEGSEDVLYVVTNRTINGSQTRYVERQQTRQFATAADAFFVDAGATYSGAPATVISGLTWLEGKTVSVLGDGAVFPQKVVTGGSITLEQACSKVQVGLPITADLYTLPLSAQVDSSFGQGRVKNINKVWIRVFQSSGVFSGPSVDRLVQFKQRTTEAYGTPPALISDEIEMTLEPSWQSGGQIYIRQSDPLPLTVVSLTVEAELGG